jgi:hypothetical protein
MQQVRIFKKLDELYPLWSKLGNIPTVEEEPFLHFPIGTHRESIWYWFEDQNPEFLVGEVMQGIRRTEKEGTCA